MTHIRTILRLASVAGFALAISVTTATAHSSLKRAEPAASSALKRAPSDVKLHFSEQLEPDYSSVVVEDAHGVRVDKDDSRVENGSRLRTSLKDLKAGTYKVVWRVLSVDTHVTEGNYTFTVE